MKAVTEEMALSRLQALCAGAEQCTADLRKKLTRWGLSASKSNAIIRRLEKDRFVDDARFARAYAHDKLFFSGWGAYKISQGLWAKGIPRGMVRDALDEIDREEYEHKAFEVLKAKTRSLERTRENMVKLMRFGASRGFEAALVVRIVKSAELWK